MRCGIDRRDTYIILSLLERQRCSEIRSGIINIAENFRIAWIKINGCAPPKYALKRIEAKQQVRLLSLVRQLLQNNFLVR